MDLGWRDGKNYDGFKLSLDFRPEIGFGNEAYDNNDLDFDIAFGIRYQF